MSQLPKARPLNKGEPFFLTNEELAQVLEDWAFNRRRARMKDGAWSPDILDLGASQLEEAARRIRKWDAWVKEQRAKRGK